MYEQDKDRVETILNNPNLTMPDRLRIAVRDLEERERRHPYVPHLNRLSDKLRREGYIEEAHQLELLAGLWGRMEASLDARDPIADAAEEALKDALGLNLQEEEEEEAPVPRVEIRGNPDAEVEP